MMKRRRTFVSFAIGSSLSIVLGLVATKASAGTMTVNTHDMTLAAEGKCSLLEALQALNTKATVNECNPGTGAVTISLRTDVGDYVIPQNLGIWQPVTLGSAVKNTKVNIRLDAGAFTSEAILVAPANNNTTVTLRDLNISGWDNSLFVNAIFAIGLGGDTLVLDHCDVGGWQGGAILADGFTLNVKNSYVHENGQQRPFGGGIAVNDWESAKGTPFCVG